MKMRCAFCFVSFLVFVSKAHLTYNMITRSEDLRGKTRFLKEMLISMRLTFKIMSF